MHAGAECPGLNWVPAVATATAAAAIQTVWPRAQRQALWAPYQAQSRWHLIIRGNPMRGTGAVWAVATLAACWGLVLGSSPPFCIGPGRAGVLDRYHTPPGGAAVHLLLSVRTQGFHNAKKSLYKNMYNLATGFAQKSCSPQMERAHPLVCVQCARHELARHEPRAAPPDTNPTS